MVIEVDRDDLIRLLLSIQPSLSIKDDPLRNLDILKLGGFSEDGSDIWVWHRADVIKLTEDKLYDIYKRCKES